MGLLLERLRELFRYEPETGHFVRIKKSARSGRIGKVFAPDRPWRMDMRIDGNKYKPHRLAWFYVHGVWPEGEIDHINGDRNDNRIANLRDVAHAENMQNLRRARSDSTSGLIGAMPHKGRWRSDIRASGKKYFLGTFDTAEQAHLAYVAAKRRLHPFGTL